MRIQHNIPGKNSYRNYSNNTSKLSKNLEKLSSGYSINRAGDDAAGLAISEKMRAQITGLEQAGDNVTDGISLVKTAEGAMQEIHGMLDRMEELATQSSNGTYDDEVDRANLQKEMQSLQNEVDRIAETSNFNGINLLDGTQTGVSSIQFTQGTVNSDAVLVVNLEGLIGESLLGGGSIQIGDTYIEIAAHSKATKATWDPSIPALKVGASATASKIVAQLKTALTNPAAFEAKGKDGTPLTYKVDANKPTNGCLQFTLGKKQEVDLKSLPSVISVNGGLQLQIGDTSRDFDKMRVSVNDMHIATLFMGNSVSVATQSQAADAIDYIKSAINFVSSNRGDLGAVQNRLEHTGNNLSVMTENIQDAESTIRDTDVAKEMMEYTKNNILIQSSQAMMAQCNQVPQGVLQLLQ